ncbi:MAG TPA: hypothetical protein VFE51_05965 [Verrucomicrobiae bacterium]|nr:hypothetical protein [Verrucomicrobiae bacterium]
MNTNSFVYPATLPCIMINAGGHLDLPDESLSARQYHDLQPLLAPGASIALGEPPCPVDVSWVEKPGWPTQFEICRRDAPLLVAGLATDAREATRLRGWFNLLQGATFRCLQQSQEPIWPRVHPWLGILLMPGALELSDAHLDALCGLGRALGQVWLRRRLQQAGPTETE